ncbi:helix-turn-helix transcriptional regulator [Streptomyces sp. NPDC002688]|uniref:helix-turn-helix domain-containing protein n=1 Tax=Streptomyces sp. NPDC002688 TaxID=3154423 RepID=UPI003317A089
MMKVAPERRKWTQMRSTLLLMTNEKRRPRPAAQYGPTAEAVAENVKRIRERRNLTIYSLSGALEKVGRPITPSAVAKIERQQRQVSVDDLAALAVVLGVSPSALLLPLDDAAQSTIEVTGGGAVPADVAWDWADGQRPLHIVGKDVGAAWLEYQLYGRPSNRRGRGHRLEGASIRDEITRYVDDAIRDLREQGIEPQLGEDGLITWRRSEGTDD